MSEDACTYCGGPIIEVPDAPRTLPPTGPVTCDEHDFCKFGCAIAYIVVMRAWHRVLDGRTSGLT